MSALRLAVATLVAVAAAGSTGVSAAPRVNPPLLTFAPEGSLGLCATDLDGHTFRVTGPREPTSRASWSPDGGLLVYSDGFHRFVVVDAEGQAHVDRRWTGNSALAALVWSPDGTKFASVGAWGAYSWLTVMNSDGTGAHTIVDGLGYTTLPQPAWSPDGSWILFSKGTAGTYVIHPDGTGEQKLLDSAIEAVWSPDGRRLAYVSLDQDGRRVGLGVANADGSDPHTIALGEISQPAWSPDGSTIAFVRSAGTPSQVALVAPDGTNERTIAFGTSPEWAPDGSWIAFALPGPDNRYQAAIVRPDGTDTHIVETGLPGSVTTAFFWRPSAPLPRHRRRCVLTGTAGADVIKGTNRGDVLIGDAGRVRLYGRGGDDVLIGGTGHDWLYGGTGDDFIDAGPGDDTVYAGLGDDFVTGGGDNDVVFLGPGDDFGAEFINDGPVETPSSNDYIFGESGFDLLSGGPGIDTCNGGPDFDVAFFGDCENTPAVEFVI
jgi:Tol biopolymer transport system component